MKIIVLHGDDTVKSYGRLKKFIDTAEERSWEVVYVDESSLSIREILSSTSLFGTERFFIIRNAIKVDKKDLDWIKKNEKGITGNLIFYNDGFLNATFLKNLPKDARIEEFKLPVLIWSFLDSLLPGNASKLLTTFHKVIESKPPEFIFTLIAKHFRDLCWSKVDASTLPYPVWRASKLEKQAAKFSEGKLKEIIEKLSEIDIAVKTSKTDLVSELDLFIVKWLE